MLLLRRDYRMHQNQGILNGEFAVDGWTRQGQGVTAHTSCKSSLLISSPVRFFPTLLLDHDITTLECHIKHHRIILNNLIRYWIIRIYINGWSWIRCFSSFIIERILMSSESLNGGCVCDLPLTFADVLFLDLPFLR